ncbi:MAG: shikimate kinase, partial [Mesorhizobium sp.]
MNALPANPPDESHAALLGRLGNRSIVFVGLMG